MLVDLGQIIVLNPGTPVRLTFNQADPARTLAVNSISIQVLVANQGNVYIGTSAAMVRATNAKVLAVLPPPTANSIPMYSPTLSYACGGIEAQTIWIDADTGNDGVLVGAVLG